MLSSCFFGRFHVPVELAQSLLGPLIMDAPQHVLVGYDGSPLSEMALNRAFRMVADARFALIHVVCVISEGPGASVRLPTGEVMSRWAALDGIRLMVFAVSEPWRAKFPHARVVVHLRAGDVAHALVDFAYRFHIDQIVLGARGHREKSTEQVGSVCSSVLALTDIPTHLEAPLANIPPYAATHALAWAHVSEGEKSSATAYTMRTKVLPRA